MRGTEAGSMLDKQKMKFSHTKQPCQGVLGFHHRLSPTIVDQEDHRLRPGNCQRGGTDRWSDLAEPECRTFHSLGGPTGS